MSLQSFEKNKKKTEKNGFQLPGSPELLDYNREILIRLLKQITDNQYEDFQKTEIYTEILNLDLRKQKEPRVFTYQKQEILEKEIKRCLSSLITNLWTSCPCLTGREILICCLALRFSLSTISLCFGYSDTNCIKQHKSRIKKKMTVDSDNAFLFDFVFRN